MHDWDARRRRLEEAGQEHVLQFVERLSQDERNRFASDLDEVDLELVGRLFEQSRSEPPTGNASIAPLPQIVKGADADADADAHALGQSLLAEGKVAAFVVAGGQGTRLGHPGPKGTYAATPIGKKPLFQVFAEKLRALGNKAGVPVPFYVMTSPANHDETVAFFEERDYMGLDRDRVRFFNQGTMPAVDTDGRLILKAPGELFRSPDGHGGSLLALSRSGALAEMRERGVEDIFYFQVDNPLVEMCDPTFVGYHRQQRSQFSSKAVPKREPGEKVGVLVRRDGKPGVIEYSDLPSDLRDARDPDGALSFRAGNIATHLLSLAFVEDLNRGTFQLPYHIARKEIPGIDADGGERSRPGIKFETFVFDALPLAERTLVMEVAREAEFSPIKNREGADSPETSRADQSELHARWLESAGVKVARKGTDVPFAIEISPLYAECEADLVLRNDLPDSIDGPLLLEAP